MTRRRISGAALVRGEWEDPIAGASPDPQAPQTGRFIPAEAAEALRRWSAPRSPARTVMLCPNPETRIEVAMDQGHVAARGRTSLRTGLRNRTRAEGGQS